MSGAIAAIFFAVVGTTALIIGVLDFRDPTRMRRSVLTRDMYGWANDRGLKIIATVKLAGMLFLFLVAARLAIDAIG